MILEKLKQKIQYGDYKTLAIMLDAPSKDAAKKKLFRENPEAIDAMSLIISTREKMIKDFKSK